MAGCPRPAHCDGLYRTAIGTLHGLGADPAPLLPAGSPLADAVSAQGATHITAAAAVKRFIGSAMPTLLWPVIVIVSRGRLLRPLPAAPADPA